MGKGSGKTIRNQPSGIPTELDGTILTNTPISTATITNSTINSTVIGATSAAAGTFTVATATTQLLTNDIDTTSGVTLLIGKATATKIELADTSVITEIQGPLDMITNVINNVGTPVATADAANKAYVDSVAAGLDVKASSRVATIRDISLDGTTPVYNNVGGTSGAGRITWTTGPTLLDGVALSDGDRMLLKDQTSGDENGIWVRTGADIWDRASDFDDTPDGEVTSGAFTFITEGVTNGGRGYTLVTPDPITVGTASGTVLTFTQFSGSGADTGTNTATTTDATVTNVTSLPTSSNTTYIVTANILGIRTDAGSESAIYRLHAGFRNNGGTLVQVGTTSKLGFEDTIAWDAELLAATPNIIVRVTGEGAKTINWSVKHVIENVS